MKTTWSFLGAAAVLSLLGLAGCSAAESEYVVTPDPGSGDSAGGGGAGGGTSSEAGGAPALKIPVIAVPTGDTSTSLNPTETVSGKGIWAPPGNDTTTETITETQTPTDTVATPTVGSAPADTTTDSGGELPSPEATTETGTVVKGPSDPPNDGQPTSSPFPDTTPAPLAPEDACPGLPFTLRPGFVVDIFGSLIGMHDDLMTSCADLAPEPKNRDVVYQVELTEPSSVSVHVGATQFVAGLAIRHVVCDDERSGDLCLSSGGTLTSASFALDAGRYWFVVDTVDGAFGNFWLQIEATVPACGDGVQNTGEDCDPGEGRAGDGCFNPGTTAECKLGEPA